MSRWKELPAEAASSVPDIPGVHAYPIDTSMESARMEAEMVIFECVHRVLEAHNIEPQQVLPCWKFLSSLPCSTRLTLPHKTSCGRSQSAADSWYTFATEHPFRLCGNQQYKNCSYAF